jgi:heterodisulfide reductase subunit A
VLGAGNVALDCVRCLLRLGASEVRMICRKPRSEVTGFEWEVDVAEEEGVKICDSQMFKEIVVEEGKITGVRTVQTKYHGYDENGRILIDEIPGTDQIQPTDIVVWATGQGANLSLLPADDSIKTSRSGVYEVTADMQTSMKGVYVAGDATRGVTSFVVEAIGEGHKAARGIDRYLRGEEGLKEPPSLPVAELSVDEIKTKFELGEASPRKRITTKSIPLEERYRNFREVELVLTEEEALAEAERCLRCGVCSECLECAAACERGAINHDMCDEYLDLQVGTIVLATGFKDFDPARIPELNYGKLDNVLSALEFERLINVSGPTQGKVVLKNGVPPKSVAIVHCVGSRDHNYNEYCSRACCMYSLKISQLVHEYIGAEVHEIYRDMRSFGKGYEEFYNRTAKMGVNFYHGRVKSIEQKGRKLHVKWDEAFHGQPSHVDVDMVVLATGFEPQTDSGKMASIFGISRSKDGFFLERHPKLAPIETVSEGIYLAGACQSPKDIPDSVAQAGAAAAAALSLLDQGVIALDPVIAENDNLRCAGCGQCVAACPYTAIELKNGIAKIKAFLCKGCGTCAASCPNKAMSLIHFDDQELVAEIIGTLADSPAEVA